MDAGVEEKGGRWKNREMGMKEVGTRIENKEEELFAVCVSVCSFWVQ